MADSSVIQSMFEQEPVVDPHVRKYELMRYTTNQPFSDTANPSEITIDTRGSGLDSMSLLQRAFIGVQFAFRQTNNAVPTYDAHNSVLIQNAWSLFSRAILYVNDSECENVDRPGVVAHLKNLVEKTRDSIEAQGPASSYYLRSETGSAAALPDGVSPALTDAGLVRARARYLDSAGPHFVKLYLRDIFGFCNIDKALMGARITLRLTPETQFTRVIFRAPSANVNVIRLQGCDLYVPVMRPDNTTLTEQYAKVNSGAVIPYEFERWQFYRHPILNGSTQQNVVIPNSAKRPLAVHALLQLEAADTNATADKLDGQLLTLGTSRLMVDSKQYPEIQYEGANKGYLQEYETFLQCGGLHKTDIFGSFVDFDRWRLRYPVISYDVSAARDEFGSVRSNPAIIQWNVNHANPGAAAQAMICIVSKEIRNLQVINGLLTVSSPEYAD